MNQWHPSIRSAVQTSRDFVNRGSQALSAGERMAGHWLTLSGVPGSGKTTLAGHVFDWFKRNNPHMGPRTFSSIRADPPRRPTCVWMTESRFAERIKGHHEWDLPEYLGDDFIVCIDDVGSARDRTDFLADALYRLCNVRLGKWTIFTTNLTLPEIRDRIDERVASRMIRDENQVITLQCGDYALRARR